MRDDHRPKQDLIHEVTGLRKQIVDLKEAMVARRDGTPLAANGRFARMLGYDSAAELQSIGGALGIRLHRAPGRHYRDLRS